MLSPRYFSIHYENVILPSGLCTSYLQLLQRYKVATKLNYSAWPLPASLHEQPAELAASSTLFVRKMLNDTACNSSYFIFCKNFLSSIMQRVSGFSQPTPNTVLHFSFFHKYNRDCMGWLAECNRY